MNPKVRNVLAVVAGLMVGSIVNGIIIMLSGKVIPPPEGVDVTNMEDLKAKMHLFESKHFIMPFLAHAIGTLVGAFLAVMLGVSSHFRLAMIVGFFFLVGGAINVFMLSAPMWFNILDLVGAYIPMAWLGYKLAARRSKS